MPSLLAPSLSLLSLSLGALAFSASSAPRPIALVTGGTRGIGAGIARVLAEDGYDLLLTYNADGEAADEFSRTLADDVGGDLRVDCVGGDISLCASRDAIFKALDAMTAGRDEDGVAGDGDDGGGRLAVVVHNAGQYVGVTSANSDGIAAAPLSFGDGSLLDDEGRTKFDTMHYYQRMYGEAFVDLCERSLLRMGSSEEGGGGTIVGISSPGVCAHYYGPDWSYSMPGAGKALMEYSMRIYAARAAARGINVNVIIPGVTKTDAWNRLAKSRGLDNEDAMMEGIVERIVPMKRMTTPRDIGNTVKFLCSASGKFLTGTVVPMDGGLHLNH